MNQNQETVNETKDNQETELNQEKETVEESELNASSSSDVKNAKAVNEDDKSETNKISEESETSPQDGEDENQESDETDKSVEDDKTVPYKRFKEVNEKYQALKVEFDKLKESNSTKSDVENAELIKYKEAFNSTLESKLNEIPESYRDLIPDVGDFEKLQWIDNAISKGLFKKEAVEFGNKVNNPSVEEKDNDVSFIKNLSRKF
jgi:hypothetical protein